MLSFYLTQLEDHDARNRDAPETVLGGEGPRDDPVSRSWGRSIAKRSRYCSE